MTEDELEDSEPEPRSRRGLFDRLARVVGLLAALVRALRQLPRLAVAWMRQHVAHVAALAWLSGMGLFVGVLVWQATSVVREQRRVAREAAETALRDRIDGEVAARLEKRFPPDAGAPAVSAAGGQRAAGSAPGVGSAPRARGQRPVASADKKPGGRKGSNPGNTVELMDLDDIEKARGGSEAEARAALPEDDEAEADGETVDTSDTSVKNTVETARALARSRGPGREKGRRGAAPAEVVQTGPDGDDGAVTVKMPPGGMAAWIARNRQKKVRIGDKETLAILQGVSGGSGRSARLPRGRGALGALAAVAEARGMADDEKEGAEALAASGGERPAGAPAGQHPPAADTSGAAPGRSPPAAAEAPPSAAPPAGSPPPAGQPARSPSAAGGPASAPQRAGAPSQGEAAHPASSPAVAVADEDPFNIATLAAAVVQAALAGEAAVAATPPTALPPGPISLPASFAQLVSEGALELEDRGGEAVLRLPAATVFRPESSELRPAGRELIRRVAGVLERWPDRTMQVVGPVPAQTGTRFDGETWSRAAARAVGVARALSASGVAPGRLTSLVVGDSGEAEAVELWLAPAAAPVQREPPATKGSRRGL